MGEDLDVESPERCNDLDNDPKGSRVWELSYENIFSKILMWLQLSIEIISRLHVWGPFVEQK